jgi:hypothetical protein
MEQVISDIQFFIIAGAFIWLALLLKGSGRPPRTP